MADEHDRSFGPKERSPGPRGWYVPHRLPHFDSPEVAQAITFRLADSLPAAFAVPRDETSLARWRRTETVLDAGHGSCLLRDPEAAAVVEAALLRGAGTQYELFAWVVMPNHVHALTAPLADNRLADVVQRWKSWTAKAINPDPRRGRTSLAARVFRPVHP